MKEHMTKVLIFSFALALSIPAVQGWEMGEAEAVVKSRKARAKRSSKKSSKRSSRNRSRTRTRTTTRERRTTTTTRERTRTRTPRTRTVTTRERTRTRSPRTRTRTVTRTRRGPTTRRSVTTHRHRAPITRNRTTVTRRNGRTTTTTTTTTRTRRPTTVHRRHSRRHWRNNRHHHVRRGAPVVRETHIYHDAPPVRRRTTTTHTTVHHHHGPRRATVYRTAPVRRRTTVHHHHHRYPNRGGSTVVTTQPRQNVAPKRVEDPTTAYLTAGLGVSGIAAPQVSNDVLAGSDFNVGLGGRSGWLAAELGFTMGGYNRTAASESDVTTLGLTADLKLQPSFGILEPYASVGVGGHVLNDHLSNGSATGGSLRLGGGLDVRIQNIAISAQYMHMEYALVNNCQRACNDTQGAASDSVGLGLKFYF